MLVSFLFWNLMKSPLHHRLARIVANQAVDIVMLAENSIPSADILTALESAAGHPFCQPFSAGDRLSIFTRFEERSLCDEYNDSIDRVTIRRLCLPNIQDVLLAVVHFQSRINYDRDDQTLLASDMARAIVRTEDETGIFRTLLVGDLNMNPFDPGVSGAQAFHGIMTRQLVERNERKTGGEQYRMFYNPMWGHFGDRTVGPSGTYFLGSAKPLNYFWNMYDQVLLRPSLMHSLRELSILDTDGVESLMTEQGRPDKERGSDHLPLLFRLEL
jgi:hypothetical protein